MNAKRRSTQLTEFDTSATASRRPVEASLAPRIWPLPIPGAVIHELASPGNPQRPGVATVRFGKSIRAQLEHQNPRLVLTSGLPVLRWSLSQTRLAVTRLSEAVGPLLSQNLAGTTLYDVRDTGFSSRPGVRRSITNEEQPFHTDGPWLSDPPRFIALHCSRPARTGGKNLCINLQSILARLRLTDRAAVARLAEPLPWHRQGEHDALESPISEHPLWWEEYHGPCFRLYVDYVTSAAQVMGWTLNQNTRNALHSLEGLLRTAKDLTSSFRLNAGESIWINNWVYAHAREAFRDEGHGRHLIRTWHT